MGLRVLTEKFTEMSSSALYSRTMFKKPASYISYEQTDRLTNKPKVTPSKMAHIQLLTSERVGQLMYAICLPMCMIKPGVRYWFKTCS